MGPCRASSRRRKPSSRFGYHQIMIGRFWLLLWLMTTPPVMGNTPPQPGDFATTLFVHEDELIDSKIGEISAIDADGQTLFFTIDTEDTKALVGLSDPYDDATSPFIKKVDIILKAPLDRDFAPTYERKLYFTITDGSSSIPTVITLIILDVNDVRPQFVNLPYEITIKEDMPSGTTVFSKVSARDPDSGTGGSVSYSMESADAEYLTTFEINQYSGNITLKRPLNYEKHSYYQFLLKAEDGDGLEGDPVSFVVVVLDVQDSPPGFVNLPYSIQILEDTPVNSPIQQVSAVDGDSGIPNNITYSFQSGDFDNFEIDSATGIITIKNKLDRDSSTMRNTGGVYAMVVKASEEIPLGQINNGETTATTLVTITVNDVNDNKPTFNKQNYMASILENMQQDVPVAFKDGFMQVYDRDQGLNSHFSLTLQKDGKPYSDFAPLPQEIYSESSILIRVNNSTVLDYETNQRIIFEVVATELDTVEKKSSTATVTIDIEDMNDNEPEFDETNYSLDVEENLDVDTPIRIFKATDKDSGKFKEIKYSLRGGNGAFKINEDTGELSVAGETDRETNEKYYMTIEAKDGGGLRTPVEVLLTLTDKNDNKPVFRRTDYEGIVPEEELQFLRPLTVEATDDDKRDTPNSEVSYKINTVPKSLESNFTIDPKTGEITLTQPLDFEKLDPSLGGKLALKVEAYDSGDPVQASTVDISVIVEDINDFAPEFGEEEYVANIPENSVGGFVVYDLSAQDFDGTSPNNKFIYRIENGALDKFRIDFGNGIVTVEDKAILDREDRQEYTLTISAIDRGTPPRTGSTVLKVILTDINDETPEFAPVNQPIDVIESTEKGDTIVTFSATDADLDHDLEYSFGDIIAYRDEKSDAMLDVEATGVKNYFAIDPTTGTVSVKNDLDRETAEKIVMVIIVKDKKAEVGGQTATGTLTVMITDYNDNPPQFRPSNIFKVNVSETDGKQSIVLQVSTSDKDEDQSVSYKLGQTTINAFSISADGTVRLIEKLDREKNEHVQFEVIAIDKGTPAQSSTATVSVLVIDANDNKPKFAAHETIFSIPEDTEVGFVVTTLTATDKDKDDFGQVYYTLLGPDIEDGNFMINETTGAIYVAKELDRETKESYRLQVEALDSKNTPDESESTRSAAIKFIITDVDDNPPVFKSVSPEYPSFPETSPKDFSVVAVTAVDKDDPLTDNGKVIYSLTSDTNATLKTGEPLFKVNARIGLVKTAVALDGYPGIYFITVMATNEGKKYSAEREIIIKVLDVNVDVPSFINPSVDNQRVDIAENQDIDTFVFKVEAEDNDSGPNGKIIYALPEETSVFKIDPNTGRITTKAVLNAEIRATYSLRIQIQDQGYPNSYSASRAILVHVTDKNDHPPEFDNVKIPYEIMLTEESKETCTLFKKAVDKDLTPLPMCYYLLGAELNNTFSVKKFKEEICTLKALDRETTSVINAVIIVDENCAESDYETEIFTLGSNSIPPMYQRTDKNKLWVKIKVADINDNRPRFKRKDLSLGVTRATQFGKLIYDLKNDVEDKDSEKYGVDYFEASPNIEAHPDALKKELDDLKITTPFNVLTNGQVQTNTYFKPQMSGYFIIEVKVVDKGGFFAKANLRISLINDDQRLKVVFRASIDTIGPLKNEIAERLGEKIKYRIVVDSVQTHETSEGKADLAKTDMFIHGEDLQTNEVIPASRLLNVIDQKNNLLVEVLNDYNVLEIVEVQQQSEDDTFEDKLKMALILVSVVLGPICIILVIVLYYVVRRYQIKLKAATAIAYVNSGVEPNNSELYKSDIPGTNLHSYENQNSMDDNVFVTESTFDEHEMAINFVTSEGNEEPGTLDQQSRPESYLKAVLDRHQIPPDMNGQMKNNSGGYNSDGCDDDKKGGLWYDDEINKADGGKDLRSKEYYCADENQSTGRSVVSGSVPEDLNLIAFNQVICELKDDCRRTLRLSKTNSIDSQVSTNSSPPVKILSDDIGGIGASKDWNEAETFSESENNNNPFFSETTNNGSSIKRNENLNSPFEVTPPYAEFRNGLRFKERKITECVELTDL